jgi:hypothetical protein
MMIRTTAKSVYYPISGQRAEVIRASARVRYLLGWQGFAELQSEDERGRFA